MNKIKIYLMFFLLFMFNSCTPSKDMESALHRVVLNTTEKKILIIMESDCGTKSIFSNGIDSIIATFEKTTHVKPKLAIVAGSVPLPIINKETTYNFSDTSFFEYQHPISNYLHLGNTEEEKIYAKKTSFFTDKGVTNSMYVKLLVDDELLGIMKKDYTMLEKFPEHYK